MTDNKNVTNDHCLCKLMQGFKVKQGLNEDCLYKKKRQAFKYTGFTQITCTVNA